MNVLFKFVKPLLFFFFVIIFMVSQNCQNENVSIFSSESIQIEESYKPEFRVLDWKDGKKAAYTLAFDDARESHYKVAWPEMQHRGFVGTFNINTPDGLNWIPWKYLAEFGNEIASHTVNHLDLTSLTTGQIEYELKESSRRITKNINKIPYSFAHPYGLSNALVNEKVKEYYLSGRSDFGINSNVLEENEFFHLKAIGVYPTITRDFLQQMLKRTVEESGYLIVTFHSIARGDLYLKDNSYMPINFFQEHLEDVLEYSNEFWIATQAEIIKYIRLRQSANIQIQVSESQISFFLKSNLDRKIFNIPLTIEITIPNNWKDKKIIQFSRDSLLFSVKSEIGSVLNINVYLNQEFLLKAF